MLLSLMLLSSCLGFPSGWDYRHAPLCPRQSVDLLLPLGCVLGGGRLSTEAMNHPALPLSVIFLWHMADVSLDLKVGWQPVRLSNFLASASQNTSCRHMCSHTQHEYWGFKFRSSSFSSNCLTCRAISLSPNMWAFWSHLTQITLCTSVT